MDTPDFRALLARARQKFLDYDMLAEESPPYEHRMLMDEIDAALEAVPTSDDSSSDKALEVFSDYFRHNYPGPDTIIHKPDWHAPRLFSADAIARYGRSTPAPVPVAKPDVDPILRLAEIIREVDGNHDKGAAALAEAILSHRDFVKVQP